MKIKEIKIVNQDESTEIADIGADAINVDYNDTTVKDELDRLHATDDSLVNIQTNQETKLVNLQNQINSLASGSPKGTYANAAAIKTANPETGVYVATENGHIYSWTKNSTGDPVDLGVYQATGISENDHIIKDLKDDIDNIAVVRKIPLVNFKIGVYSWYKDRQEMTFMPLADRVSADLRNLELSQGDTVGITDYTTYSMAFGDNDSWPNPAWYKNSQGQAYQGNDITANNTEVVPYVVLFKRNDEADITEEDILAISSQFHSTSSVMPEKTVDITDKATESIKKKINFDKINNFIHFSFDDVTTTFNNLNANKNTYTSIFEEPFMNYLKSLHDTYRAKFSLYVYDISVLNNIGNKFKKDFMANSDWLKIGFHAYNQGSLLDVDVNTAKTQYETFIQYALNMAGLNSIDRIPRLNFFAGSQNQINALRDAKCGIYGLLTPDDDRTVGYLNTQQHDYLLNNCNLFDKNNGLIYYATNFRLDWFVSGFSSQYTYNVPTESNPYDELVSRYSNPDFANLNNDLVVFTHEWQLYTNAHNFDQTMKTYIEQVMQFANEYGYVFDYVQNRVQNIKSLSIS